MRKFISIIAAALIAAGVMTTAAHAAPQYPQQYVPNNDVGLVTSWYQRYLGRNPETNGLMQWVQQLQIGYNVEAGILGSDEYYMRHGSTPQGFIVGLYQDVLGRQPRVDEIQSWLDRLQVVGFNREAMAGDFLNAAQLELGIRGGTVPPASPVYTPSYPLTTSTYVVPNNYYGRDYDRNRDRDRDHRSWAPVRNGWLGLRIGR